MVDEARLEDVGSGLAPVSEGWFVVNVRDAAWETSGFGGMCAFEGADASLRQLDINVRVLRPDSSWLYHSESNKEDFLVVAGECLLLVEGEERSLKAWDFVHGTHTLTGNVLRTVCRRDRSGECSANGRWLA